MFKYFFTMTQIPLGICPEGIYLDNKVILFQDFFKKIIFWLISKVTTLVYTSAVVYKVFPFAISIYCHLSFWSFPHS